MGVGKIFDTHLDDLGSRSLSYQAGQNLPCPLNKVRTTQPVTTKLGISPFPLLMLSTWLNFGGILSETFFSWIFPKISNPFFPIRTFYLPYLRNGWSNWCETKRKWVNWMLWWLGYLWPWPLTLRFQGQILSRELEAWLAWNVRTGVSRMPWCETLRKWVNCTLCWLGYFWPWPLTLNFQGQIVSREWEAWLSWNERDASR